MNLVIPVVTVLALILPATAASAAPQTYTLDPMHSLAVISYDHVGLSTTFGMLSGFEGKLILDRDDPGKSSVSVSVPIKRLVTGNDERDAYILDSGDLFHADEFPETRFVSTAVDITGATMARVSGNLTINGVTRVVVFDATFNGETDAYLFPPLDGRAAVGFDAVTTILRSDFNLGLFAPYVGDEVTLRISFEAMDLG